MKIYKNNLQYENEYFLIRLINETDCESLLEVYSDKLALPFFNNDDSDEDNSFYNTKERMADAIKFWKMAYENGWFVRLSIIDKKIYKIIGTVEISLRVSEDCFNNMGILRVDVKSNYETLDNLYNIFTLSLKAIKDVLRCDSVITKAPIYAVDRIEAIKNIGFVRSNNFLIGKNNFLYDGYWIKY